VTGITSGRNPGHAARGVAEVLIEKHPLGRLEVHEARHKLGRLYSGSLKRGTSLCLDLQRRYIIGKSLNA
jgi:hypothetical protein